MDYQRSDIKELVEKALTTEKLKDLLFENFPSVYDDTEHQTRGGKIRNLIDYVEKYHEIPKLLKTIQKINPITYEKFLSKLEIAGKPEVNQGSTSQMVIEPISKTNKELEIKTCDVLVLAANPSGTEMLDLEKEANLIRSRLQEGEAGKSFVVQVERAVQVTDLSKFLLQYQPLMIHFSGHGNANGEIILNNDQGQSQALAPAKLAELLAIVKGRLECVIPD